MVQKQKEKKILLCGTVENCGPGIINNAITNSECKSFGYSTKKNRYLNLIDLLFKTLFSDVILVSSVSKPGYYITKWAKFLRKKVVYHMHGDVSLEYELQPTENMKHAPKCERYILEHADAIIAVSKRFMHHVQKKYPEYANKVTYVYNGIDVSLAKCVETREKVPGTIAAAGGCRNIKNNVRLAYAVEAMDEKAQLKVYGNPVAKKLNDILKSTTFVGLYSHELFLQELSETELFVVNSLFETFNQASIEALLCGCSILVSEKIGVIDLLTLEEYDIIHDPNDEDEIKRKIEYLLMHPNNERIVAKLNLEELTYAKMIERIESICESVLINTHS